MASSQAGGISSAYNRPRGTLAFDCFLDIIFAFFGLYNLHLIM